MAGTAHRAATGRSPTAMLDAFSVASFALLWGWVAAAWLRSHLPGSSGAGFELLAGLAVMPLGVLAADFATGCAHWFADRFFEERTPVIGALLIRPFREHHRDPRAITRHGVLEVSGNNCLACVPLLAAAVGGLVSGGVATAFLLWSTAAIAGTNLLHQWAHAKRVPATVRWLQRRRCILGPEQHALHHREEHDRGYCVTTGWLNPLLDRVDFFGRLERGLRSALPGRRLRGSA